MDNVSISDLRSFAIKNNNTVAFNIFNAFDAEQKENSVLRKVNAFLLFLIPINIYFKGALYSVFYSISQKQSKSDFICLIAITSLVYLILLVINTINVIKESDSHYIRLGKEIRELVHTDKFKEQ